MWNLLETTVPSTPTGDSGGGLVIKNTVYGIVRSGCDTDITGNTPGIYINVCEFRTWIKSHTGSVTAGFTRSSCTVMARSDSTQAEGKMSVTDDPAHLVILVTMRDLQVKDTDWYWCGAEISGAVDDSACLYLNVVSGVQSVWVENWLPAERGGSVTIPCHYNQIYKHHVKYWCKGFRWKSCSTMVRTDSPQSKGDVSITDDPNQLVFTVTMRNLQDKDSDTYWCAVEIGRGSWQTVEIFSHTAVCLVYFICTIAAILKAWNYWMTSAKSNSHAENVRGTSVDDAVGHLDKPVQGSVLTLTVRLGPQTEQWTSGQVGLKMDRNKSQNDYVKHSFWSHSPSLTVKSQGVHPAEGQE
ncbi:hypothetical protein Z043_121001 [Scleropages formosus]|uniref:Immunoglobulin domain-containing protein n=1 Tax=Scleropages formosus TaxID=113540 RepID=A0A0N8JWH5_SCLFO|nr:hypothetical protein Z043_121001 [Scleropages formosus]